ncbi:MAG TPA: hypothetical protein VG323_22630 [Thermoanaerobaculia bacterium]|nr:hypothetical protein [Thermoanaerobaculia bacterium]
MLRQPMSTDPRSHARAAVLAGALAVTPPDIELVRRAEVVPVQLIIRRQRPPLDLDAPIYRYRIGRDGRVSVIDEPIGARSCRRRHRHR